MKDYTPAQIDAIAKNIQIANNLIKWIMKEIANNRLSEKQVIEVLAIIRSGNK